MSSAPKIEVGVAAAPLRVFALYCLSGFVSLGYQVAWFRIYVDQFGATNLTFALVLCNFTGGLGAGALLSRRLSRTLARWLQLTDYLRVYGVVEIIVGVTAVAALLGRMIPPDTWGAFPYVLHDGIYVQGSLQQFFRLAITTICLFVPCFFMGVTFPLLCSVFRGESRFPSRLYAWNTLGALSGVLLCQFVFLPWIGHDLALTFMAGINLLLGGFFFVTGGARTSLENGEPVIVNVPSPGRYPSVLLTCAVISGLLAGSLEGDMFRRIKFFGYGTAATMAFASFWAILGIFLASWIATALRGLQLVHIKVAFLLALAGYAIVTHFPYRIHEWVLSIVAPTQPPQYAFIFPAGAAELLIYVGIFVFPTYLLISLLLPYVCNRIHAKGHHLGIAYGVNTLAFCLGIIAFTWIAPSVSVFYSMKLVMVLLAVGIVLLLSIVETRRVALWKPLAAAAVLAAGCVLTPAGFDADYLYPMSPATRRPVRAVRSNGATTTFVVQDTGFELLYFDNTSLSNTAETSQLYMRLMAHFPLLAQPNPRAVLLICYGVGNTASAIASHDTIKRIDVVEMNGNVLRTAPEFARATGEVHLDPRVQFINDDGRNFLNATDRVYDLITSEPPPPLYDGIHRLYSQEYYESAMSHLSANGMMSQWVPTWQLPPEAAELILSTFVSVFPHTIMFTGRGNDFVIVGSRSPIDLRVLEDRYRTAPKVAADLKRMHIDDVVSLLARVVKGDRELRVQYAGKRVISDQHNQMANRYADMTRPAAVSYNPARMFADVGAERLRVAEQLRQVVMNPSLLRKRVPDFPMESLE